MTQDEIIAMAKQVGFPIHHPEWQKAAEEFAALIEEKATVKERENWPAEMKAMENQVNILTDELCNAVKSEREAIYQIVSHAPFIEAFDDGELQSEIGDALKSMAFSICAAIRARGEHHG